MQNLYKTGRGFYLELIFSVITLLAVAVVYILVQHKLIGTKLSITKPIVTAQQKMPPKAARPTSLLLQPRAATVAALPRAN